MAELNAFSSTTLGTLANNFTYAPTFTVNNELADAANGLFAGITNGSTYFGPLAGNKNTNLTSVDLSNTNIEALNYGDLDETVTNPANDETYKMPSGTFANASNLTDIRLPASCSQFGLNYSYYSGAFAKCTSLANLNFKNFDLNTKPAEGSTTAPTGFAQINQQTWVQVANIMNALAYFGQQNIVGNSTETTITNQDQMNAITYTVNANPVAAEGTWVKWVNDKNENIAVNTNPPMILRGMSELAAPRSNFNYPINAYPAGSYGYSVSAPAQGDSRADAQVTVNYPAGLGTSVSANFKGASGDTASPSNTVTMANGSAGQTLQWNTNSGVLMNGQLTGSNATTDTNVVFNTSLTSVTSGSTITLTDNSTRPQSVWYTVSASGSDGSNNITQAGYNLTQDESNNIFAVTSGKIPGALNDGAGGVGGVSLLNSSNIYTTAVGGRASATGSNTSYGTNETAVDVPSANNLKTGTNGNTDITLSQNYLPLGITANVKDAYFNHNGIIWHYHNGFESGTNDGIYIEGKVNAYIGGTIQGQESGADYLSIKTWTTDSGNNTYGGNLASGVYDNGIGLTSVGSLSGVDTYTPLADVYGIDGADLSQGTQNTVCYPYVSLFGGKMAANNAPSTGLYSQNVGPANVTVKLTLVPGSAPSTPANK